MSCGNNLKQIGLAMHLYHDQRHRLPPSRPLLNEGPSWAWLILPNLEQDALYEFWDWQPLVLGRYDEYEVPRDALSSSIPTYFCPSRRAAEGQTANPFTQRGGCIYTDGIRGGLGDYAACIGSLGTDEPFSLSDGSRIQPDGAFRAVRGFRFAEIRDGLSNTLMVGEKQVPEDVFGEWPWDCSIYDGHNSACNTRGAGPNFPLATRPFTDYDWKFGSYHPGQCQFVFCDGSVRPLENDISPVTLGLLAQRNDRKVIPLD
ncbi:MAG TPA: DUF1559 domain-containing protein [Gemmataceae bacterium]